jgi:response regulator of citrate/malate metabolism
MTTDIILLDLGLPDGLGLEVVRRAHAAAPRVPLVVLTCLDDETLAAQAPQEGAQDYLVKSQIGTYGTTRGLLRALRYSTERKVLEDALFAEKERAQVTLNSIGDAVACTDNDQPVNFAATRFRNVTFPDVLRALKWRRRRLFSEPTDVKRRKIISSVDLYPHSSSRCF